LLTLVLLGGSPAFWLAEQPAALVAQEALPRPERVVYIGGDLSEEDLIHFTATVAGSTQPGVVLLEDGKSGASNRDFLAAYRAARIVPVGSFPEGVADLEKRLAVKTEAVLPWKRGPPEALWKTLYPQAERVVVCYAEPRRPYLQAACLAGTIKAPLFVLQNQPEDAGELQRWVNHWRTRELLAVGKAVQVCKPLEQVRTLALADEDATAAACRQHLAQNKPIGAIVLANPSDTKAGGMAGLAPLVAIQHQAALLLTGNTGTDATALLKAALTQPDLRQVESLLLVAHPEAIRMDTRPNPVEGKDKEIEMEPLTPHGTDPFTLSTGRLFHADRTGAALLLARPLLLNPSGPRRALVVSNPGGGLPLLETISRNTAQELANGGYETKALFNNQSNKEEVRRLLPSQDLFLWEGHHQTLVEHYEVPTWTEPLRPALVFLQSCLALEEEEVQPLLNRGVIGVIGSSTRTYSGTGGAFSLAYFDALLYDDQTVGGALRQAKNFLLAYSLLKEKRLGDQAKLNGVNLRSAWAFTLWGDPTVKLPRPQPQANALPHVKARVVKDTIVLAIPEQPHAKVTNGKYEVQMLPNARLAGLLTKNDEQEDGRNLVPLLFAEVALPKVPPGQVPQLRTKLTDRQWVFCWDGRRQVGYLLVAPGAKERKEIRFTVE